MNAQECFTDYGKWGSKISDLLKSLPDVPDNVARAWEQGGLFVPTWDSEGKIVRLWLNVIAHNVAVARLAYGLALCLIPVFIREDYAVNTIKTAALLHDSFKKREWEMVNRAKQSGKDLAEANREAEVASSRFLKELGFENEVVLLAESTGDFGLEIMARPGVTIGQKIIIYADCCVFGSEIVSYKERFDALLPDFQPGGKYEFLGETYRAKYGESHRKVWDGVILPIQDELARLAKFRGSPTDLYTLAL